MKGAGAGHLAPRRPSMGHHRAEGDGTPIISLLEQYSPFVV
jgi:hypothetical protein